jgi:hypothetical protein
MENKNVEQIPEETQEKIPEVMPAQEEKVMLTEKYVETAGRQIELRSKLLMTALKALKPHDFQDFEGKPYLEGEGAARIMAVVRGFKVGEAKFKIENIAPHYFIECEIPMEWMGQTTVALGDCSTADPFFTGKAGNGGIFKKHLDRTGSETMAARLVLGDAKKKARENAISRGVSELLGIKGLSWDDLAAFGFRRAEAGGSIQFKTGSQGGEIRVLQPSEALTTKAGSIIHIIGILVDFQTSQVGKDKKDITSHTIKDLIGDTRITVKKWGKLHAGLEQNQKVFCSKCRVADFRGSKQFLAESIEGVDNGGTNSDIDNSSGD